MAEKGAKKKKGKGSANVLGSLPSTRPNRLGRDRRGGAATTAKAASGTAARATPAKAASAASRATAGKAASKAKAAASAAKAKTTATAKAKRSAPAKPVAKAAASTTPSAAAKRAEPRAAAKAAPKTRASAKAKPRAGADVAAVTPSRPKPVRSASKRLEEPAKKSADKRAPAEKPPSGTELVTTVVQAAGELASVGLSIGGQIVKRAVDRLPKP